MSSKYPSSPGSASGGCPGSPTPSCPSPRMVCPASPTTSTRSLDDLLMCPVCLDSYKDPKTLACLHSFCYRCLENCRRPYRRDITCPVCKKVTSLSPMGIAGLQNDFRIQQIRDILINRPNSPGASNEDMSGSPGSPPPNDPPNKLCDLCKSVQKNTAANCHCIQCYMFFCCKCVDKHNANQLFSSHHVINMTENKATETLFCKTHKEHPVRYFCKPCSLMMCTICTMDHNPAHTPEPLEKGIIDKYKVELQESLRTVRSKLSEVKSCSKYLEILKQSHQRALYDAQSAIRDKTEDIIQKIRDQEQHLLKEVHLKIEIRMKEYGVENLGEVNLKKSDIEVLYSDIQKVIKGSPQDCLVAYEDIISRMKMVKESSIPSMGKSKLKSTFKFIPASELNIVIGSLMECQISDSANDEFSRSNASSPEQSPEAGSYASSLVATPTSKPQQTVSRRMSSILSALSPGRKVDLKIGKVKAYNSSSDNKSPSSPSTINADDLLAVSSASDLGSISPTVSPAASQSNLPQAVMMSEEPAEPSCSGSTPLIQLKTKLLFKVDQIGGWPGRISSPSGMAFMPDNTLVVAECENRLQIFDRGGHSIRIIGWGKVKPQGVVVSQDGKILITDKKDKCVKLFDANGDMTGAWGVGVFNMPSGIAISRISGNVIVSDVDCNSVSIHNPDGSLITKFGSWGSGDYQFNNPTNLVVDHQDNIVVSDSGNGCIKIFDRNGVFIRKFSLQTSKQGQLRRPQGISTDSHGNILIADRDNHRISVFTNEGQFVRHLLTKQDGIKYPCDVGLSMDNHLAVVETHSGFLTKDPHHAIKLFQLTQ